MTKTINFSDKAVTGADAATITFDFQQPLSEQILKHFTKAADYGEVVLPVNGVAAITTMATLRVFGKFPIQSILDPGKGWDRCGALDLEVVRHEAREKYRQSFTGEESAVGYVVVNYGHPLTPQQIADIAFLLGTDVNQVSIKNINAGQLPIDPEALKAAVFSLLEQAGISRKTAAEGRVVMCPPTIGHGAACLAAAWHGAYGALPTLCLIGMKPGEGFQVLQLVKPEEVYVEARKVYATAVPTITLSGNIPDEFRMALTKLCQDYGVQIR